MLSVGTDLIEIKRIEKSMNNARFMRRVFGESELAEFEAKGFPAQSVAAAFAAKEAFGKSLQTGVSGFSFCDVEMLHDQNGAPFLKLSGNAMNISKARRLKFSVSVTHTGEYASAVVIAYENIGKDNGF